MRVGLVYNLKPSGIGESAVGSDHYAEWDNPQTIEAIRFALAKENEVLLLDAQELSSADLQRLRPDFVFNIAEGSRGAYREAEIPAILEALAIPYTGSAPPTLSLCLDKARAKKALSSHGIPTPRFHIFTPGQDVVSSFFPAIVKPNWEGSSIGILNSSVVSNPQELRHEVSRIWKNYEQPALVEEYLAGREFTAAILGNGANLEVLPIVEISLDCLPKTAHRIYSYEAKWLWDKPENPLPILRCPAPIAEPLTNEIRSLAIQAFKALDCRDWCRIDFRSDAAGNIFVLEVNPLPGILPDPNDNSAFPLAARRAGLSYDALILKVLRIASQRAAATPCSTVR